MNAAFQNGQYIPSSSALRIKNGSYFALFKDADLGSSLIKSFMTEDLRSSDMKPEHSKPNEVESEIRSLSQQMALLNKTSAVKKKRQQKSSEGVRAANEEL